MATSAFGFETSTNEVLEGIDLTGKTILEYAGDSFWSYQEDLFNPAEGQEAIERWIATGGGLHREPQPR